MSIDLLRDQILTGSKVLFTFLVKFLSLRLAGTGSLSRCSPGLGSSQVAIAGFTAREIILIDKLVRISKMHVLEELDSTKLENILRSHIRNL